MWGCVRELDVGPFQELDSILRIRRSDIDPLPGEAARVFVGGRWSYSGEGVQQFSGRDRKFVLRGD